MSDFGDMLMDAVPPQEETLPEPIDTCTPEYKATLERVVKGAEFIASLPTGDARYKPAMVKYDKLCEEARRLRDT
ncbi:hypothetical protein DFP93_101281 [Aneurinibacillus soli]|uniref:Uncharacterized protein n=1 Tax=Aneurinibacillus soli TaxID=1500254 RepID=A0A0U5BBC4_9BACL|nr:hypothetical protein [Aneurinibacillus soli]PYE64255.1 hypothetical protein DFP93_101281 [Aneurinibacillus soli]BAU28204.1 hypothetical protein CB4_02378 [Aneurinibacillus soli]